MLAGPELMELSAKLKRDQFYALPKLIETFICRATQELPRGWTVDSRTLNRSVSLFHKGRYIGGFSYEDIEDNIVVMLDYLHQLVKQQECV